MDPRTLLMAVLWCQCALHCTGHRPSIDWSQFSAEIDAIGCEGASQKWTCAALFPLSDPQADAAPWNSSLVVSPSDMDDFDLVRACHCDEQCVHYGDCCRDANAHWSVSSDDQSHRFQCLPLVVAKNHWMRPGAIDKWNVYMIGRCPESEGPLAAMCQRHPVDDEHYTYMLDVPVLSLRTNVTYANIFCAQCHDDAQHLEQWNAGVECKVDYVDEYNTSTLVSSTKDLLSKLTYVKGERRWHLGASSDATDWRAATCFLTIQQFTDAHLYIQRTGSRRCVPRIESCAGWASAVDRLKCGSYTRYMQTSTSGQTYKNPHCARCNYGAQSSTLHCFELNANRYRDGLGPLRPDGRKGPTHSMSLIFDFTLGGAVGQERRCQDHEFWDHVHEQCHAVTCADAYERQGATCVAKRTAGSAESDCPRIRLFQEDFYLDDDGQLVLNASGKVYNRSQFDVVNDTVFICAEGDDTYLKFSAAQSYLSTVCLSISVICLALHIVLHLLLPKLRNLPGKNLLSLSCALLGAQLLFLTSVKETELGAVCSWLGALTHWFFLSSFFWMNVMGLDICRTFSSRLHLSGSRQRTFCLYSLYAWGSATLLVAAALVVHWASPASSFSPQYGAHVCWISNRNALAVFFALPVALLLAANVGLFGRTVSSILQQKRSARFAVERNQSYKKEAAAGDLIAKRHDQKSRKHKIRFVLYIKLALIMGLGWLFGFLASVTGVQALWYPFILFNGLQGLFILLAFDLKHKIYLLMWERVTGQPHPSVSRSTSKATTTSSISHLVRSSIVTGDIVSGPSTCPNRQSLLASQPTTPATRQCDPLKARRHAAAAPIPVVNITKHFDG